MALRNRRTCDRAGDGGAVAQAARRARSGFRDTLAAAKLPLPDDATLRRVGQVTDPP